MINRTTVRTRVVQALFAYYQDGDKTITAMRKELTKSYSTTYSLYIALLDLVNELTSYATQVIEDTNARARVTHQKYEINRRFINNQFAQQVFECQPLRNYVDQQHLSWDGAHASIPVLFRAIEESEFYRAYMQAPETTYEEDKKLWKNIFTQILAGNETLTNALEDLEITLDMSNWTTDSDVVISYILKTIKRAKSGEPIELLPIFDHEEEALFGENLLRAAIENHDTYLSWISAHLKNWESDRVAMMDKIIMETALAEIFHFNDIAIEVSMNEYIELAKEYSGEKSYQFINGVLNEILQEKKREGVLIKLATLK